MRLVIRILSVWLAGMAAWGQELCPNGSFEMGTGVPDYWSCTGGGYWTNLAHTGSRAVYLETSGCGNYWSTLQCPLEGGRLYSARFAVKAGTAFSQSSGELRVEVGQNKLAVRPDNYWRKHQFIAVTPQNLSSPLVRLEQCNVKGGLFVDDLSIRPAIAVPLEFFGQRLGEGESLSPGKYTFRSKFEQPGWGYSRALHEHTAYYDWWRWLIGSNQFVTYKHSCGGALMTNGLARLTNYWADKGILVAEASLDGENWLETGRLLAEVSGYNQSVVTCPVPASMLPCTNIFVRLRCLSGRFYVRGYSFAAGIPEQMHTALGKTCFFELEKASPDVLPVELSERPEGWLARFDIKNPGAAARDLRFRIVTESLSESRTNTVEHRFAMQSTNTVELDLLSSEAGENVSRVDVFDPVGETLVFSGSVRFFIAIPNNGYVGYKVYAGDPCDIAWCGNTYKVGRTQWADPPLAEGIEIKAARHEYEPFQLVLRPKQDLTNASVSVSDLILQSPPESYSIGASNVEICVVEYVPVQKIVDPFATPGDYPDPLVPLQGSFSASRGTNQPVWITVYVPKNAPAGTYQGTVSLSLDGAAVAIPLSLVVRNFTLSDTTHTKTAYKLWLDQVWYKHTTREQSRQVWELYMENFRRHRINPAIPHLYANFEHRVAGDEVFLDTKAFDETMMKYLDEFSFGGFNLLSPPPSTLGGYSRYSSGYQAILKKLIRAVMSHLRCQGWADRAYAFWYDEPWITGQYSQLIADMALIREAAPDLLRVSTTHPEERLYGSLDVWVPMADKVPWTSDQMEGRRSLGEQEWWYIACYPRHPYPNYFIDHPAINQRIRRWLAERYQVTGDLYWATTWYKGPNGTDRNPWLDPMSSSELGNGDGMLLYPPTKTPPSGPVLDGPINSLRWELVRESMEDGEYFWLLRQAIERNLGRLGSDHSLIIEANGALAAVQEIAPGLDDYDYSPSRLMQVRDRVAAAIEAIENGSPMIVTQPLPKSTEVGRRVEIRVEALGWPLPEYQWFQSGILMPGATDSVLTFSEVTLSDAGSYTVSVSNSVDNILSEAAILSVRAQESAHIVIEPPDLARHPGESAILAVGAAGSEPISYYWTRNGDPVSGGSGYSITFSKLSDYHFGHYQVIVSNSLGWQTSRVAILSNVFESPRILVQPHSVQRFPGESAHFEVSAAGTEPLFYKWWFNGGLVPEAATNTLLVPSVFPESYGLYRVSISNIAGCITSAPAGLYSAARPLLTLSGLDPNFGPTLSVLTRMPASIFVSTNLVDWAVLTTIAPADDPIEVYDDDWMNWNARFYQVREE